MKNIVLIDDDKDFLEVLTYILSDYGFTIIPFESPVGVIPEIRKRMPMAVVVDFSMPVIDGITFTKKLKNHKATKRLPVIIMSAHKQVADQVKNSGADYFLPKPFDVHLLIKTLNSFPD